MKGQGRARLLLGGLLALGWLAGGTSGSAEAQDYVVPGSRPVVIEQAGFKRWGRPAEPCCPPGVVSPGTVYHPPGTIMPPVPTDPSKIDPKDPGKKVDPGLPPAPVTPIAPGDLDASAQLSPSGGLSGQNIAPNLFGDRFGGSQAGLIRNGMIVTNTPFPGGGGGVGRVKVSEVTNPLPRDRFIFTYDFFDNTPLRAGGDRGQIVNRYAVGVEKTFWDGLMSIEVRQPFASTRAASVAANNQFVPNPETTDTQLGNLHLALRALLYRSDTLIIGAGTSFDLPTARDTRVRDPFVDLTIRNQTVMIEPYLSALFTPNERLFSQAWVSIPFAANDDDVQVRTFGPGALAFNPGTVREHTRLILDYQVGYWIIRNDHDCSRRLRGLAPFAELHYTTSIEDPDSLAFNAAGNNYVLTDLAGRTDDLNLTLGVIAQFGDNLNVSLGTVLPLQTFQDQQFDYQVGLRVNWFYGRTARERSSQAQSSGF